MDLTTLLLHLLPTMPHVFSILHQAFHMLVVLRIQDFVQIDPTGRLHYVISSQSNQMGRLGSTIVLEYLQQQGHMHHNLALQINELVPRSLAVLLQFQQNFVEMPKLLEIYYVT